MVHRREPRRGNKKKTARLFELLGAGHVVCVGQCETLGDRGPVKKSNEITRPVSVLHILRFTEHLQSKRKLMVFWGEIILTAFKGQKCRCKLVFSGRS